LEALFDSLVTDINAVRDAYERAEPMTTFNEDADRLRRQTLMVSALLRNRVARLVLRRRGPRNIVVFGGNNVGKSTVVNIIAAAPLAGTSPEGGYTRHARAFTAAVEPLFGWNPYAFDRFRQVPAAALPDAGFDCYAVVPVSSGVLPDGIALWDSPDCDAVGSARYLPAVIEAVAVADLVVYVTSVEKYAVADLVEWVFDLADAGIPILECLNKTARKDRPLVIHRQEADIFPMVADRLGVAAPDPRVVALRYMTDGEESDLWGPEHPEASELRDAAFAEASGDDGMAVLDSIIRRIDSVLEPARMELAVRADWQAAVRDAVAGFVATYEEEYLSGDAVIDPFRQLNAALLDLLNPDIPLWGGAIRNLRAIQRIPTRLIQAAARGFASMVSEKDKSDSNLPPELRAYALAHRALTGALLETITAERRDPRHHPFWDAMADHWDRQAEHLADEFSAATVDHLRQTDDEIKSAARDVLDALKQRPNVLAALKMARVSLDVGGLLVGFIIPGHGSLAHDLLEDIVIAPAMLGATGFAAESAVEGYVAQRRGRVVQKLRDDVRAMAAALYAGPLDAAGEAVMSGIGTIGLPEELLDRIPENLQRLREGLAA
jgi:hypothetical protein